jgi:hypothetical protein
MPILHRLLLVGLLAFALGGCASPGIVALRTARNVVSGSAETLNKIEPVIERSYREGLRVCMWDAKGKPLTTPLEQQEKCVDEVDERHKGATTAYKATAEVVTAADTTVLAAEASLVAGRSPSASTFIQLVDEVLRAVAELQKAHQDLRRHLQAPPGGRP